MGIRNDHIPWSPEEYIRFATLSAQGASAATTAAALNAEFHGNAPVRTQASITNKRTRNAVYVAKRSMDVTPLPPPLPVREQEVQQTETNDGIEAKSSGTRIRTVEDLLRHIDADMTRFEIAKSEATKYETAAKHPETGKVQVTELHRVYVQLKPKAGPSTIELVEAMISGSVAPRKPIGRSPKKNQSNDVMQALVIADPHVGKYAWSRETGWEDYDVRTATDLLRNSAGELLEDGTTRNVGRRAIMLLGDYFHYDTPHGATTKGTPLDRDGRVEKMVEEGASALFDIIAQSADLGHTEVILVPGNHDALMTVALRQILTAYFRKDDRVTIDARGTSRKYVTHGNVLLGMTHGDKAKKRLHELMAAEVPELWGKSTCREIHTGHLHGEAAVDTVSGVTIRTHRALCPPDGWHAIEGYVAKPRGMQAFYYHKVNGLLGMTASNPDA